MRKEEKTRLRREKIITAALFEFATKGYQGFVINELCKVDGILRKLWQCFWGWKVKCPP